MQHNNTEKDRNPAKLGDPQADQTTIPMQQIQRLPDSMQRHERRSGLRTTLHHPASRYYIKLEGISRGGGKGGTNMVVPHEFVPTATAVTGGPLKSCQSWVSQIDNSPIGSSSFMSTALSPCSARAIKTIRGI